MPPTRRSVPLNCAMTPSATIDQRRFIDCGTVAGRNPPSLPRRHRPTTRSIQHGLDGNELLAYGEKAPIRLQRQPFREGYSEIDTGYDPPRVFLA